MLQVNTNHRSKSRNSRILGGTSMWRKAEQWDLCTDW